MKLAELREQREAGVTIADSGGISVGEPFGSQEAPQRRRNRGTPHPAGSLGSVSTAAVNLSDLPSWELRRRRAALKSQLAAAEWEWEKDPSPLGTATNMALRTAISVIEQKLTELAGF